MKETCFEKINCIKTWIFLNWNNFEIPFKNTYHIAKPKKKKGHALIGKIVENLYVLVEGAAIITYHRLVGSNNRNLKSQTIEIGITMGDFHSEASFHVV